MKKVFVKVLGEDPDPQEEIEKEEPVEYAQVVKPEPEEKEEEDPGCKGITYYLFSFPIMWLIKKITGEEVSEGIEEGEEEGDPSFTDIKRMNLLARCTFLFISQGMLAILVGKEILLGDVSVWYAFADSVWIVFARFLCGIVLHV